nr:UvrD-helicase domain-containing protein [Bacteriovorax sp. HI3]
MIKIIGCLSRLNLGEAKTLEWIKTCDIKRHFTVLVEPSYQGEGFRHARWPDFVLITKKHGVCILECKSHSENFIEDVSNTQGIKLVGEVDRYQVQLREYYYLIEALVKDLDFKVPIVKGAVFPHISKHGKVAQAIIEHHHSGDLFFKEDLQNSFSFEESAEDAMSSEQFNELCKKLNKESIIDHNYGLDEDQSERRILKFSQDQIEKINRVQHGNYLFHGLPGTGKTKMLVAIAKREEAEDKRIGFVCFNRPLRDSVAKDLNENSVYTISQLLMKLCRRYQLPFDYKNTEMNKKSLRLILSMKVEPLFDVLLIDEYQDLEEDDYKLILKCVVPDALIVLAGDPLQEIKDKEVTWKSRGIHVYGLQSMFLAKPYRTEASIVDYGLRFLSENKKLAKTIDKYFQDHNHWYDFKESREGVRKNIYFWLNDKIEAERKFSKIINENPNSDILIITNFVGQKDQLSIKESARIKIEPYSRVKGLEADIVLIYNTDFYLEYSSKLSEEAKMRSLFSAICRSRGKVIIHGFESKDFFHQLLKLAKEYLDEAA